jgi:hypothetical protein
MKKVLLVEIKLVVLNFVYKMVKSSIYSKNFFNEISLGDNHIVDSNELAFMLAAEGAIRQSKRSTNSIS